MVHGEGKKTVGKCENGFSNIKVSCNQEAFYLDHYSGMDLCFWCWWVDMDQDTKIRFIDMGLNIPEDNRPKEFRRG